MFWPEIFRLPVSLSVYNLFIKIKSTRQNNADNSRFPGFWRFRKYCSSDFCENGLDGTAVKNYPRTEAVLIGPGNSGRENRQFCSEICKNHKFVDEKIKKIRTRRASKTGRAIQRHQCYPLHHGGSYKIVQLRITSSEKMCKKIQSPLPFRKLSDFENLVAK